MAERILAVDGIEKQVDRNISSNGNYINSMHKQGRAWLKRRYELATWIDSNLNGSCMVDPFGNFHFYEESDAVAFKIMWPDDY